MKIKISILRYLAIAAASILAFFAPQANAVTVDKIVVFGDSLSDTGNIFSVTSGLHKAIPAIPIIPKADAYYQGRFSNGPVWVDDLAEIMKIPMANYAYGGSWAEPLLDSKLNMPFGLGMQVNFYLVSSALDFHKKDHLYIIWVGGNDYLGGRSDAEYATTNTVANIRSQIEWLSFYGAKNFLVLNLPDLGMVPQVVNQGPDFAAAMSKLIALHNQKFANMLAQVSKKYPDLKIVTEDVNGYFTDIMANPEKYHLTNVHEACYNGGYWLRARMLTNSSELMAAKGANIDIMNVPSFKEAYMNSLAAQAGVKACAKPDEYLFWDAIHPTRAVHQVISSLALVKLSENDIKS